MIARSGLAAVLILAARGCVADPPQRVDTRIRLVLCAGAAAGEPAKAGTPNTTRKYRRLATVAACAGQPNAREAVTQHQQAMSQGGPEWLARSRVLDRLRAGERDESALCEGLDSTPALLIETLLQGLADPATLADLLPTAPPGSA